MATDFDDFETCTTRIWNHISEAPKYAYFCWRWDESHRREGETRTCLRASDPIKTDIFTLVCFSGFELIAANRSRVLDIMKNFVNYQDMHQIQMEKVLTTSNILAMQLWETYGHTPTRLLYMWRWAKSSDAVSMCQQVYNAGCARPICKLWYISRESHASKTMILGTAAHC
jgi:hypothetical protein